MSTAKELLLLSNSQEEQQRWVSHLLKRIPRKHPTMSPPSAAQNTPPEATPHSSPRLSPRPSPRESPRMSAHRGAIKIQPSRQQQSSGKTRWGTRESSLEFSVNSVNIWNFQPHWNLTSSCSLFLFDCNECLHLTTLFPRSYFLWLICRACFQFLLKPQNRLFISQY